MGGALSTHIEDKKYIRGLVGKPSGKDPFENTWA